MRDRKLTYQIPFLYSPLLLLGRTPLGRATNMVLLGIILLLGTILSSCTTQIGNNKIPSDKKNVLFIAVDDLRPELACYGQTKVHTPNIDQLADKGYLFEQAYCNIPVCGASRASIMTGLRPTSTRFLKHNSRIDEDAPAVINLATHFKNHGYRTISLGKVLHHWDTDALQSWTDEPWHPGAFAKGTAGRRRLNYQLPVNNNKRPAFERAEVSDSAYHDGKIANQAIKKLQELAKSKDPFFIAVGFVKPHLPFNAPAKYWDRYDREALPKFTSIPFPENAPTASFHPSSELRTYDEMKEQEEISNELAQALTHGYYACVSYIDALVGQLIQQLEQLNLASKTIIVLWGDHGWSLGEHNLWCKHSTYKVAMQAPLLVYDPDKKGGQKISGLVEFIDLYPSLIDLVNLPKPTHLQGESFTHLLDSPKGLGKDAIYGRWKNGELIKTDQYSYTQWTNEDGSMMAQMLFDHLADPNETINLADRPEYKKKVEKFRESLKRLKRL